MPAHAFRTNISRRACPSGPRRRWRAALVLAAFAHLLAPAGCSGDGALESARLIRIANSGFTDFDDIPAVDAQARLEASGYRIQTTQYRLSSLAAEALAKGDADIGLGALPVYLTAAARGAPIRLVGEHVANPHRLVAPTGTSCRDLRDAPIAVQSQGASTAVLTRAWMDTRCAGTPATFVFIPQSDNRLAALLSGNVAASVLKVAERVRLERLEPGRFSVVADFSHEWPDLIAVGLFVNADWAEAHPADLDAYLEARREATAGLRTVDALAGRATEILGRSEDWEAVARAYVDDRAWWPDVELDRARLETTLRFFTTYGGLPVLAPEAIADLSPPWLDR